MDWEDEPDMQLCRVCREEKFIEEFQADGKGGHRTECRTCCNLQRVRWAHSTPQRHQRALAMRQAYVKRRKDAPGSHTDDEWQAVLVAYEQRCAYCGRNDRALVKEHVTPLSAGGTNDIGNLVPACQSCNARKLDRTDVRPLLPPGRLDGCDKGHAPATMGQGQAAPKRRHVKTVSLLREEG